MLSYTLRIDEQGVEEDRYVTDIIPVTRNDSTWACSPDSVIRLLPCLSQITELAKRYLRRIKDLIRLDSLC